MKKIFVLSMLISFAMICSCQKQDTAAEQQLAQRKAELDAREKALDERREKAFAERERATMSARTLPPATESGGQVRAPAQAKADPAQAKADPAQVRAERDRRLQQLPPDAVKMLIPDASRVQADNDERDKRIQELLSQRQSRLEEVRRLRMSAGAAPPAAEATSPPSLAASPAAEATSPSPSPTPQ